MGARPDHTITSQSDLDSYANTSQPNSPLTFAVTANSGTNLTLTADNITFDKFTSIHVQWRGDGHLTWINKNGTNAEIFSNIGGGTYEIKYLRNVTFTNLQSGSEIRIYEAGTENEVSGVENSGTTFSTELFDGNYDIRIFSINYKVIEYYNVPISEDTSFFIQQFEDLVYEND
jgi:hypothetical protein